MLAPPGASWLLLLLVVIFGVMAPAWCVDGAGVRERGADVPELTEERESVEILLRMRAVGSNASPPVDALLSGLERLLAILASDWWEWIAPFLAPNILCFVWIDGVV